MAGKLTRWQLTFNHLDELSRKRALTDSESRLLERAIEEIDNPRPANRSGEGWTPDEERTFEDLILGGTAIREAARIIGRSESAGVGKWSRMQVVRRPPKDVVIADLERRGVVKPGTALGGVR